ncbi:uncharacterized protein C18orf19 homolog B-like isoform X2 [Varroa jacobsoni]|uniref:uncharacterized protein C18orf19 homolog B-like isoform X2 n=1 Tax=Varroa jacobsoni TaxID=62625 RepID=UPI000BF8E9B5|nr:uncharacterized protein C18orf19 homolog B-like isoform X2 [Varroa jacobsoni]
MQTPDSVQGSRCLMTNRFYLRYEDPKIVYTPNDLHSRNMNTSLSHENKHAKDSAQTSENPTKSGEDRTLFQRFKDDFARYWYVMLPVHITTSFGYFLCFYYLSKAGISPVPLMDFIGIPAQYVDPIRDSAVSHVAVGYAGYKLIAPIRYVTTIAVTGVTVRALLSRGILQSVPTFSQFKESVKTKIKSMRG